MGGRKGKGGARCHGLPVRRPDLVGLVVRWTIDSDPNAHFRLRPHLTRHTPCRCGRLTSLYPEGISRGSVCSSHLTVNLTWTLFLPRDLPPPLSHLAFPPLHLPPPSCVQFMTRKHEPHPPWTSCPAPCSSGHPNPVSYVAVGITLSNIGYTFVPFPPSRALCYCALRGKLRVSSYRRPFPLRGWR